MLLLAALLAAIIGLALGLLGGGGSILTLPMLVYVLGVDAKEAIASSLFVVGITSVAGVLGHARAGNVRWRIGLLFGVAGMAGAAAGGELAHYIAASVLLILFAVMMLLTAAAMMRGRRKPAADAPGHVVSVPKAIVLGVAVGVISGLVGAGGGFLVVPALVLIGGLGMAEAVGTSLLVIAMQSLAGFASHARHTALHMDLLLVIAAAAVAGSIVGIRLARHARPATLRRAFGWLVLAMGVFLLGKQLPPGAPQLALLAAALVGVAALLARATVRARRARSSAASPLPHASSPSPHASSPR
jgi:uncharacterized membrane protein YfcA